MTRPIRYLLQMLFFLAAIAALAAGLHSMLIHAFLENLGLNALIVTILFLGILWNLHLILRIIPEVNWLRLLRNPRSSLSVPPPPKLLAPMAGLLATYQHHRTDNTLLPSHTTNTLLDSLSARMDEGRDISRYITQLLVFLGLLGTFYGLLLTVKSIADVISAMSSNGTDIATMFEHVKSGLIKPLNGMATAFSGSMFGLAGSLILGFLDLTTGQAQNRFYNELEEWLLTLTQLEHHQSTSFLEQNSPQENDYTPENNAQENSYYQAFEAWILEIQKNSQIHSENLTILQRNLNILRDISLDANQERQQIFLALQQLNQNLETITHRTIKLEENEALSLHHQALSRDSIETLEKIERQIAGLRDDLRRKSQ